VRLLVNSKVVQLVLVPLAQLVSVIFQYPAL